MKVLFLPDVEEYLFELMDILYQKQYFSYYDSAISYVEDLVNNIQDSLCVELKKKAPEYFSRYGKDMYYVKYKKNHNTQWYVFFTIHDDVCLVRYITNNHVCSQHV